jgi:hypothetical protein
MASRHTYQLLLMIKTARGGNERIGLEPAAS